MKRPLRKVYDPIEKQCHIESAPGMGPDTLCCKLDTWDRDLRLKQPLERSSDRPLNCWACATIFRFCNSGTLPR